MINEPIIDAKFIPPSPPRHQPKHEESAEIALSWPDALSKKVGNAIIKGLITRLNMSVII